MILLQLFFEFFKIGMFSIGGGLATLPYLYQLSEKFQWFTSSELIDMIAISESTPGPIGVNMATFAGYKTAGVLGGVIATMGIVVPALIIIIAIATVLTKFKQNKHVQSAFYGIRPAVAALILASAWSVICETLFTQKVFNLLQINWYAMVVFGILLALMMKTKKHPALFILIAGILGVFIPF